MAASVLGMGPNERGSVLSTVRQNLLFLSSPPMAKLLSGEGRHPDLKAWKMGGMTIYLCLPASRLHRHNRFFRLILNRLLGAVESTRDVPAIPAVMILDEMHVIGHMAVLETAAGLIAGYGVRIWSIWQDFAQLKDLYRTRWETFLGNASVFQSFGLNDMTTLDYVSKRLGASSMMSISQSELTRDAAANGLSGQSRSIQGTPLLSPDEVAFHFSRQSNNQLILYPGADPIWLKRTAFYEAVFQSMRPRDE
jgi:type IV secretion system protein VirD4